MLSRNHHSRRNKQQFSTAGAEVLEQRRMLTGGVHASDEIQMKTGEASINARDGYTDGGIFTITVTVSDGLDAGGPHGKVLDFVPVDILGK